MCQRRIRIEDPRCAARTRAARMRVAIVVVVVVVVELLLLACHGVYFDDVATALQREKIGAFTRAVNRRYKLRGALSLSRVSVVAAARSLCNSPPLYNRSSSACALRVTFFLVLTSLKCRFHVKMMMMARRREIRRRCGRQFETVLRWMGDGLCCVVLRVRVIWKWLEFSGLFFWPPSVLQAN